MFAIPAPQMSDTLNFEHSTITPNLLPHKLSHGNMKIYSYFLSQIKTQKHMLQGLNSDENLTNQLFFEVFDKFIEQVSQAH